MHAIPAHKQNRPSDLAAELVANNQEVARLLDLPPSVDNYRAVLLLDVQHQYLMAKYSTLLKRTFKSPGYTTEASYFKVAA